MREEDGFKWPEAPEDSTGFEDLKPIGELIDQDESDESYDEDYDNPSVTSGAGRPVYRFGRRDEVRYAKRGPSTDRRFPWWFFAILAALVVAFIVIGIAINRSSDSSDTTSIDQNAIIEQKAADAVAAMTTEQKVAQLFFVTPEQLTGADTVVEAGDTTATALASYPVGGIIYSASNIETSDQLTTMISNTQSYSTYPLFIGVTEEGGTQSPIANSGIVGSTGIGSAASIAANGDSAAAYSAGHTMGGYLKGLGFNVDFAPVADVLTNADNPLGDRIFSSDASVVSDMVAKEVAGLQGQNVSTVLKHFPGIGSVAGDSDAAIVSSDRTLTDLQATEYLPFTSCLDTDFIMVGNTAFPQVSGDTTPACLSRSIVTDQLRDALGYDGIIISDNLNVPAITGSYPTGTAAVAAIEAGCDMVLTPDGFVDSYNAVLAAVNSGQISTDQLDASVTRIMKVKYAREL